MLGREGEFYRLRFDTDEPLEKLLLRAGRCRCRPTSSAHADTAEDAQRYQTVFARHTGAVAAPTAGLHFDEALLAQLDARGVQFGHVTLHVGAGTFQPVQDREPAPSTPCTASGTKWAPKLRSKLSRARRARGRPGRGRGHDGGARARIRARTCDRPRSGRGPFAGDTAIFIFPGLCIPAVDVLLTNFHLPESTLMMLVSAPSRATTRILAAYEHAMRERYRFFSYGDAMLLTRTTAGQSGPC